MNRHTPASTWADLSLSHFTDDDSIHPRTVTQSLSWMKPLGLWLSVDGEYDWPAWCRDEDFRDTEEQNRFHITLDPTARILHLSEYEDLVSFTRKYGQSLPNLPEISTLYVNWQAVSATYDGIIISPYSWSGRNLFMWYYGWDCASGCIWNADVITAITRVTHHDGARSTDPKETLA